MAEAEIVRHRIECDVCDNVTHPHPTKESSIFAAQSAGWVRFGLRGGQTIWLCRSCLTRGEKVETRHHTV